jgi:D-arabinose 1-dehydrogenase-like Zn-dependent alcohol dehydrogenase
MWPEPACPRDGVVVDVLACGICRSDWHVWSGADPVDLPHIPGHEYCGVVVEAGPEVRGWHVGDRVIAPFILACGACGDCRAGNQTICATQVLPGFTCDGAFAERVAVAHADANLTRLPEGMDPGACRSPRVSRDHGVACADGPRGAAARRVAGRSGAVAALAWRR